MRFVGILLIVAGMFYAVARPWFSSNFTGEEHANAVIFDKNKTNSSSKGWKIARVFLDQENNPARIRIKVWRLPGQIYGDANIKLLVRVAPIGLDGKTSAPIINQQVFINLENVDSQTLPQSDAKLAVTSTREFEIDKTGQYKIGAYPIAADNVSDGQSDLNIDKNIIRIDAVVMGGVEAVGSSSPIFGGALVVLGIIMLSIFKRRKSNRNIGNSSNPTAPPATIPDDDNIVAPGADTQKPVEPDPIKRKPVEPAPIAPKPQTDVGKTIKWGRDAGKKR